MAGAKPIRLYEELRRRRRAGWIYSLICLVVASGIGVVLSSFLTPFLLLIAGLALKLSGHIGISPRLVAGGTMAIETWARYQLGNFNLLLDRAGMIHSIGRLTLTFEPLARLSTVAAPALAVSAVIWLRLRALNLQSDGSEILEMLSARPPNRNDQAERRLGNILDTVAIAAGVVPTPRLYLINQPIVNAAAVGTSPKNAAVVVTSGLVDAMSPAEIEATMGRLVAMICAGDLAVAQSVNAAFQTFGFALTLLDLPVRLGAWRTLADFVRVALAPLPSPRSVARVAMRLDDSLESDTIVDIDKLVAKFPIRLAGQIVTVLLVPFILVSALFKLVLLLWTGLFMGPPLWLMWYNRCLWTDATAARRNLDPVELARAIDKMTDVPAGVQSHAYLFFQGRQTRPGAGASQRRTATMVIAPPASTRTRRLLALAGEARAKPASWKGRFIGIVFLAIFLAVVAVILVPLLAVLVILVCDLTLLVMTIVFIAGLNLVVILV